MITVEEIKQKALRGYGAFLQSWIRGEPYTPLTIPVGKLPTDFVPLRAAVQQLQAHSKAVLGYGYSIEWQQQQKRSLKTQTLPARIILETATDFLCLIDKEREFLYFQQDVALIREQIPQLEAWMVRFPRKVIEYHSDWLSLLTVCHYFLAHPRPGLYIRELPLNVHTKYVEEHTGILRELLEQLLPAEAIVPDAPSFQQRFGLREEESLIHARFLDHQLEKSYDIPLSELCAPRSQFARLDLRTQRCMITENKMTFLTLPALPDTFALHGGGFKVGGLAAIPWLRECPIIYWGDLDAQGFQILSQLRAIFPQVISLMMDEATLQRFSDFWVTGMPCSVRQLPYLTPEEHALFLHLVEGNIRLEQERISHAYALEHIYQAFQK
ncbi:MAG TPA: Wadjet anti-phage system protein JetD domain-containing protein [Ktedonobacteraceae bacterium]|nr:Wadjet anti-phage system protein JetD domain-containing protein [Ktedonobacteraceae bacterium]